MIMSQGKDKTKSWKNTNINARKMQNVCLPHISFILPHSASLYTTTDIFICHHRQIFLSPPAILSHTFKIHLNRFLPQNILFPPYFAMCDYQSLQNSSGIPFFVYSVNQILIKKDKIFYKKSCNKIWPVCRKYLPLHPQSRGTPL